MSANFTVQDLSGSFLAFLLFSFIFVFPGYVVGWYTNLFDFRNRLLSVRYMLGIVLSIALTPILLFLTTFFLGSAPTILLLTGLAILWGWIEFQRYRQSRYHSQLSLDQKRLQNRALVVAGIWVVFSITLLVDIQFGKRLYFSYVAYDYSTRVAVIDAITRTGVPPINPGYFPGQPVLLTQLYYFWYILCSLVDRVTGSWVSPQQAMIASVPWSGLGLMAGLVLYFRFREIKRSRINQSVSLLIPQLLLVGGLDAIPVFIIFLVGWINFGIVPLNGHPESWNMPVMSWLNALTWVPHHVAGALACMVALMSFLYAMNKDIKQLPLAAILSGFAFASAVGLSFWTMFVFAFFWVVWVLVLFLKKTNPKILWMLTLSPVLGILLASPFIIGLLSSGNQSGTSLLPVKLYIRPFMISKFFSFLSQWELGLINLISLPINYFFELGFYFVIAIIWYRSRKTEWNKNPYFLAEVLLVSTVILLLSFVRSTVIAINDLGIRSWLLAQFIFVIWTMDLLGNFKKKKRFLSPTLFEGFQGSRWLGAVLYLMVLIGFMTTLFEVVSIRFWTMLLEHTSAEVSAGINVDNQLGLRTYDARLTYQFIAENVPEDKVVQYNPTVFLDRPSGLYGNHQMAISDHTVYGVPMAEFQSRVEQIGSIFQEETNNDWNRIDQLCNQYSIDFLIFNDNDPIWKNINVLISKRLPVFRTKFYILFPCGSISKS